MKKIGILGAGQLGRMLALAGYPLDMDFLLYDTSGSPSAGIGEVISDTSADPESSELAGFLSKVDIVTYEFEHLPLPLVRQIEKKLPVHPSSESLRVCQNRGEEKALFSRLGIPTPAYRVIDTLENLEATVNELGVPVVVKTTTEGYDGKGQFVIREPDQIKTAWEAIGNRELIVEKFISFKRELSVIAVRSTRDEMLVYPLAENQHADGILRYSTAPAPRVDTEVQEMAERYIKELMHELSHVGILTLELFETENGLLANEMAPRVHNSGHWSIEGAPCSQFENHLRAISDLPLGCVDATKPTAMINIIGEKGDIPKVLELPYAHVHLYGKSERPGRKLGHVTVQADSYEELIWRVKNVASLIPSCPDFSGYSDV